MEAACYKVIVVRDLLEALPRLAGQTPRGFDDSATWHNANGTFDASTKRIIVAEKIQLPDGRTVSARLDETVQHEFGHAYDYFLGTKQAQNLAPGERPEISQCERFTVAYNRDVANLGPENRGKLAYFLQPGPAGSEELFAQMFPVFFGRPPAPDSYEEILGVSFPDVLRLMSEARKADPDYERLKDLYNARLRNNLIPTSEHVSRLL